MMPPPSTAPPPSPPPSSTTTAAANGGEPFFALPPSVPQDDVPSLENVLTALQSLGTDGAAAAVAEDADDDDDDGALPSSSSFAAPSSSSDDDDGVARGRGRTEQNIRSPGRMSPEHPMQVRLYRLTVEATICPAVMIESLSMVPLRG